MTETVLPGPSIESQIIYRLASLEATVNTSLRNIDDKLDTLTRDFHHKDVNRATQIAALDTRITATKELFEKRLEENKEQINQRVTKLEFFRTELLSKSMAVAAVVGLIWVVFGDAAKKLIGVE
jgi:hypothetical protein